MSAAREFPVIFLTGPRQSGKTTLLKELFGKKYAYVSVEPPDIRASAVQDPRSFLKHYAPPVIFDEIQYAPELLPYIKEEVDSNRNAKGRYILTGSQNILLFEKITESLAGRAAVLRLLPMSNREIIGDLKAGLPWEAAANRRRRSINGGVWKRILRGGYPELVADPARDASTWFSSYLQTYIERDVRLLRQIGDLVQFQNFIGLLVARNSQLLNLTDMSKELGIAVNTIKGWLSVLEATYQVIILRPYFANIGKRLVKTPKVYLSDTGLLCHLAGLETAEHAMKGPMGGSIFETAVLLEVTKTLTHRGVAPHLYFWRTSDGHEVDLVVDLGAKLIPIEIKLTSTPSIQMAHGIKKFRELLPDKSTPGYLIYQGDTIVPLGGDAVAFPFTRL